MLSIAGAFVCSRALVFLVGYLSTTILQHGAWYGHPARLLECFMHWDTEWYLGIVREGYSFHREQISNVAFWPLFPLLTHAVTWTGLEDVVAGFCVSNVCTFLAVCYLYALTKLEFGAEVAMRAVCFALLFPGSLYFSMFYTEGTFLLCSIACLYYARTRRWWACGLFGYLATLSRFNGLLIVLPVGLELLRANGLRWRAWLRASTLWVSAIPLGTASYMAYQHVKFGNAFAFAAATAAWGRRPCWPWQSFTYYEPKYTAFHMTMFIGSPLLVLALSLVMAALRFRPAYVVYSLASMLLATSTFYLESMNRYMSVVFPMYMCLAVLCTTPTRYALAISGSAMFLGLTSALWTNGYWMT